jgi:sulfhydrogenase subunit beta (sulfur reductase)
MRRQMKKLEKGGIARLLDGLLPEHAVYAPVRRNGILVFDRIMSGDEATLDYTNTTSSPKHVVMPQMQTLLSSAGEGQEATEHLECGPPLVLFGARPCDARALVLLDRVFGGGRERDSYYMRRREALTVISLGCTQPQATCFCTTTGGGPLSADGSDILLEDCGDGYLVHVVSERGSAFALAHGLRDPSDGLWVPTDTGGEPGPAIEPPVDLGALKAGLDGSFDDPEWQALTEKCLGCGACSYLCPACHCFDLVDEEAAGVRVRNRIWDTCQFSCFTAQASGFNPRPTSRERYRQRILHKFSYCIDNYGMPGCVGCGRCVSECPVNLDIRQVLAAFQGRRGDR